MLDIHAEREAMLQDLHPVFREVDQAVDAYIELVRVNPESTDEELREQLYDQGIEPSLARACVIFVPMAWGRLILKDLGMTPPETFIEHDRSNGQQVEKKYADQMEFVWAKTIAGLYWQSPEYSPVCQLIATRSAEIDAVNNALNGGITEEQLRETEFAPTKLYLGEPERKSKWWKFW
jgi:hypothetical protein